MLSVNLPWNASPIILLFNILMNERKKERKKENRLNVDDDKKCNDL